MLPIFKNKLQTGVIVKRRQSDEVMPADHEEAKDDQHNELEQAAKELLQAMDMKDHKAIAKAFHKAFKASELMPHEEVEHDSSVSPHTYDAQNLKAGQERED